MQNLQDSTAQLVHRRRTSIAEATEFMPAAGSNLTQQPPAGCTGMAAARAVTAGEAQESTLQVSKQQSIHGTQGLHKSHAYASCSTCSSLLSTHCARHTCVQSSSLQ